MGAGSICCSGGQLVGVVDSPKCNNVGCWAWLLAFVVDKAVHRSGRVVAACLYGGFKSAYFLRH